MQGIKEDPSLTRKVTPEAIREQLELLVEDHTFRTSKRSVQFLRYVVEQTLNGASDQIKERTIGVEVFGRQPSYDTAADHVVRTAAIELRKRLTIYYSDERHRSEIRMSLVPGSYVPRFALAEGAFPPSSLERHEAAIVEAGWAAEPPILNGPDVSRLGAPTIATRGASTTVPHTRRFGRPAMAAAAVVLVLIIGLSLWRTHATTDPAYLFWRPLIDGSGPVLLAIGDIPNGPPSVSGQNAAPQVPIISKSLGANVPYADTVTIARVLSTLQSQGKMVLLRPEASTSFSDFRDNPAVLIGAFNNEWSLRLTHQLRFSLAMDPDRHVIYIRDAQNPASRAWSQPTDDTIEKQLAHTGVPLKDYALISRVWNPETGHVAVVIGGLYAYGTEAAGEFVTDPKLMRTLKQSLPMNNSQANLQIVLETGITDDTPGRARVLAVDAE